MIPNENVEKVDKHRVSCYIAHIDHDYEVTCERGTT